MIFFFNFEKNKKESREGEKTNTSTGIFFVLIITQLYPGFAKAEGENSFPDNYPHYYNWSAETNSFQKGFLTLPEDAPSLHSFTHYLAKKSYSQESQDVMVFDILQQKEKGYFVDLACNHWRDISNSLMLEQIYGWEGICIEANPSYHRDLLTYRRCKLFVKPVFSVNNEVITFRFNGFFSGVIGGDLDNHPAEETTTLHSNEVNLTTVTLTTIIDFAQAPSRIDYQSKEQNTMR